MLAKKKISKKRKIVLNLILVVFVIGTFIITYKSFLKKPKSQGLTPLLEEMANEGSFEPTLPSLDEETPSVSPEPLAPPKTEADGLELFGRASFKYLKSPEILFISPNQSPLSGGVLVNINGFNFGQVQGQGTVTFGNTPAVSYKSWSETKIEAIAPPSVAGPKRVTVTTSRGISNFEEAAFTYVALPPPVLSSVSPSFGSTQNNTTVTITGANFGEKQLSGLVTIDARPASSYLSWSDDKIEVVFPPHSAGSFEVSVKSATELIGTLDQAFQYIEYATPIISSLEPRHSSLSGKEEITITGANFGQERGAGYVTFNNIPAESYLTWSETKIVVLNPPNPDGVLEVKVRAATGLSSQENLIAATYKGLKAYLELPIEIIPEKVGNPNPFFVPKEEEKEESEEK